MRNVAQDRSCWAGQAMLFQRCGMSVSGVFVRSLPRGQRLQLVEIGDRNCVCIVDSGVTF